VCGLDEANYYLRNNDSMYPRIGGVVSLGPEVPAALTSGHDVGHIHADFDDIVALDSRSLRAPQRQHIIELIDQVCSLYEICLAQNLVLLIHCKGGISRSTAIAIAVLIKRLGWDSRSNIITAVKCVRFLRPQAFPNERIIAFTDEHFELDGILIEAVDAFIWSKIVLRESSSKSSLKR
jgi:predicted protein tyrosine phosphatase